MNHDEIVDSIQVGMIALDQSLPTGAADKLATLLEELARWGQRINLTAIRGFPAMVSRHVLDSLAARPYLQGDTVLDVGAGAGFPGLPLAITDPQRQFALLDSHGKKVDFIRHVTAALELGNARAIQVRAEDYAPGERFDTVIARALTALPRLIELTGHLLREDGVLLALKGKYPAKELDELPRDWDYDVTELTVPGLDSHSRHMIVLRPQRGGVA